MEKELRTAQERVDRLEKSVPSAVVQVRVAASEVMRVS